MYEKFIDYQEDMEDGYCRLKGNRKKYFVIFFILL